MFLYLTTNGLLVNKLGGRFIIKNPTAKEESEQQIPISLVERRNKIVNLLESYGFRVQKSVFEIELTESQYRMLKKQLNSILTYKRRNLESDSEVSKDTGSEDSIKFYILSKVGEGNLDGRIDGLGAGYQKIYFNDFMIL